MKKYLSVLGLILCACGDGSISTASLATVSDDGKSNYRIVIQTGAASARLWCAIYADYWLSSYTDRGFNWQTFPANTTTEMRNFDSPNLFMVCNPDAPNMSAPWPTIRVYEDGIQWVDRQLTNAGSVTLRDGTLCDNNGTPEGVCSSFHNGG